MRLLSTSIVILIASVLGDSRGRLALGQNLTLDIEYDARTGDIALAPADGDDLAIDRLFIGSRQGVFTGHPTDGFDWSRPTQILSIGIDQGGAHSYTFASAIQPQLDVEMLASELCVDGTLAGGSLRFSDANINGQTISRIGECRDYVRGLSAGDPSEALAVIHYTAATGEVSATTRGVGPAPPLLTTIEIVSLGGIFTGEPARGLNGIFDVDTDHKLFRFDTLGIDQLDFGPVAAKSLSHNAVTHDLCVSGSWLPSGRADSVYEYPGVGLVELTCSLAASSVSVDVNFDPSSRNLRVNLTPDLDAPSDSIAIGARPRDVLTTLEIHSDQGLFDPSAVDRQDGAILSITPNRLLWHDDLGFDQIEFGPIIAAGTTAAQLQSDIHVDAITALGNLISTRVQVPEPIGLWTLTWGSLLICWRRRRSFSRGSPRRIIDGERTERSLRSYFQASSLSSMR